jgi:hypothetical protein
MKISNPHILFLFLTAIVCCFILPSCARRMKPFDKNLIPAKPDYTISENWAAHPSKQDSSDLVPDLSLKNIQPNSTVDVFWLHPTSYTSKKSSSWNANIDDKKINLKTDNGSIKYQSTIFNGVANVYAPRYRQATLKAFFVNEKKEKDAKLAFEIAYSDTRAAFIQYLKESNKPFFIASHSQGTLHAERLIREFIDTTSLKNRLICAYLVGMPVRKNAFRNIPICKDSLQTGCYCSWRAWKEKSKPRKVPLGDEIAIVNPLSWNTSTDFVDKKYNSGGVLRPFNKVRNEISSAQIHNGILWVSKPKFKGSTIPLLLIKNYHAGDYNIFYMNVRNNAALREKLFWKN